MDEDPMDATGGLDVRDALLAMATAVRSGEMMQARGIGERCVVPLSLTAAELSISGKLSEGAESVVYRGCWRGRPVAVKKVRIATSADLDRFKGELAILAELSHPAVVPLLGARCLPPDYMLVLPMAPGGNVRDALHERGWRPSWRQLLGLAHQVACGMEHVHAAGVLHRDIKPANLLMLDSHDSLLATHDTHSTSQPPRQPWEAGEAAALGSGSSVGGEASTEASPSHAPPPRIQIADFGISVQLEREGGGGAGGYDSGSIKGSGKPTGGFYKRQMVGTLEYMAPELLMRTAPPSRASDVYAWAVVANEMATGIVPFSDCTKDNPEVHTVLEMGYGRQELAAAVCAEGLRPLLPRSCPRGFAALMHACWANDPAERPSFAQVRHAVEQLVSVELPLWEQQQQGREEDGKANGSGQAPTVVVEAMAVDGEDLTATTTITGAAGTTTATITATTIAAGAAPTSMGGLQAQALGQVVGTPAAGQYIVPPITLCANNSSDGGAGSSCLAVWRQCNSISSSSSDGNGSSSSQGPAVFNAGVFEAIGPRDTMEDRYVLLEDLWGRNQHHTRQPQQQQQLHPPVAAEAAAAATMGAQAVVDEVAGPPLQQQQQKHEVVVGAGGGAMAVTRATDAKAVAAAEASGVPLLPVAAVFDGHRGREAADLCRARLAVVLRAAVRECATPTAALRRTFVQLEEEYLAHWQQQRSAHAHLSRGAHAFPGTTAIVALLTPPEPAAVSSSTAAAAAVSRTIGNGNGSSCVKGGTDSNGDDGSRTVRRLYVANAGDCRAVLVRARRAVAASRDHTGLLEDERARLAAAGVAVTWQHGSWRIGTSGLQVTRCIGDFDVKTICSSSTTPTTTTGPAPTNPTNPATAATAATAPSLGSGVGVTAVPEVTCVELHPDDHFLILGSDGLWDVMSVQEAAGLVYDTVKDPTMAAKRLVCEALMRGSADNVTAVVVFLTPVATLERVYGGDGESYAVTGTAYGSRVRLDQDRHVLATADEVRDTY